MWGNERIKFQGKCLVYPHWIKNGIVFINDIIDQDGTISQRVILDKLCNKSNWISEFFKLKNAIPKEWLKILKSDVSVKSLVKTEINFCLKTKPIANTSTKDIYNYINNMNVDQPPGFTRWKKTFELNSIDCINRMLHFTFYHIQDNKLKIFRWKLLHQILPCKTLLFQWKIANNNKCNVCDQIEDYEHFFINCQYFYSFWRKIEILLNKIKIGAHILTFQNLMLGYKINDVAYYDVNVFLTILLFTVHKSTHMSAYKQKNIEVYSVFRNEFVKYFELSSLLSAKTSKFLCDIAKNI